MDGSCEAFPSRWSTSACCLCEGSKDVKVDDGPPKSKSKNCVFVKRSRSLARSSALMVSGKVRGDVELRFAIAS